MSNLFKVAQDLQNYMKGQVIPDEFSAFIVAFRPIIEELYGSNTTIDSINDITFTDDYLYISAYHHVFNTLGYNYFEIPYSVITADDPIKAAKIHKMKTLVADAKSDMDDMYSDWRTAVDYFDKVLDQKWKLEEELGVKIDV